MLVGGASRRFGTDKADAMFRGSTLLDNALTTLRAAGFESLAYVGGSGRTSVAFDAPHVADIAGEQCTLRGVVSSLDYARCNGASSVLMLACDIPLVTPTTITRVYRSLPGHDAAVARAHDDHWSLIAVSTAALPMLRNRYENGKFAMHDAFATLRVARVQVDEREMLNANEPGTLSQAIADKSASHE